MARDEQAMSAERLAEIESRVIEASYPRYDYPYSTDAKRDMSDLLAEVERLRAREAALVAVVRAVAEADNSDNSVCYQVCDYSMHGDWMIEHEAPCVVKQARALLASAGEQEGGGDGA